MHASQGTSEVHQDEFCPGKQPCDCCSKVSKETHKIEIYAEATSLVRISCNRKRKGGTDAADSQPHKLLTNQAAISSAEVESPLIQLSDMDEEARYSRTDREGLGDGNFEHAATTLVVPARQVLAVSSTAIEAGRSPPVSGSHQNFSSILS